MSVIGELIKLARKHRASTKHSECRQQAVLLEHGGRILGIICKRGHSSDSASVESCIVYRVDATL